MIERFHDIGWAWKMQPSEMDRLTISRLLVLEAQTARIGEELRRAQS
ncbi:hypothetical protein [Azospirillum tabaci]|nr:hypothetical protein [Azospirillum tabaci]